MKSFDEIMNKSIDDGKVQSRRRFVVRVAKLLFARRGIERNFLLPMIICLDRKLPTLHSSLALLFITPLLPEEILSG